jgi:acetyl-CoA carboxylase biotin carboxyl carrier protein
LDANELRDLIELISKSSFVSFELEREGFKLKLQKGASSLPAAPVAIGLPPASAPGAPAHLPLAPPTAAASGPAAAPATEAPAPEAPASGFVDMTSPIVGTFYRQPSPTAAPFVEVGSRIKKGQILCVIEAMKLMNEIEAEIDAEVVEILVANGQPVEFGEVLFRLRPLA